MLRLLSRLVLDEKVPHRYHSRMSRQCNLVALSVLFLGSVFAESDQEKDEKPLARWLRLKEKDTELLVPIDWKAHAPAYEGCLCVISSDDGKTHSHHVVLVPPELIGKKSALDFAKERFQLITKGDRMVQDFGWHSAESHGGMAHRRVARMQARFDEGDDPRPVWFYLEVKQFEGVSRRTYLQLAYLPDGCPRKMRVTTSLTMNSVRPIEAGKDPAKE